MADTISNMPDAAFLDMVDNMRNVLTAHPTDYPMITAPMPTNLDDARDAFNDSLPLHVAAQADARAKRIAKDEDRDALEALVRQVRALCKAGKADDAAIAALGIPSGSVEAPSVATTPIGKVDTSKRLQHTISWTDSATPENKRKPRGVLGVEIWRKIDGPPPTDESECTFVTLDASTPYVTEYDGADGSKTAHYMLRWRYKDGSTTAWSETVSATIGA